MHGWGSDDALRGSMSTTTPRPGDLIAGRYRLAELAWPGSRAPFLNVNTPDDLTAAALAD